MRFLEAVSSLKSRIALTTAYAAGLRVSEVVCIKIADVDSQRMVIRIEHGKGSKDRYVMLSQQLLSILRSYWLAHEPSCASLRASLVGATKDIVLASASSILRACELRPQTTRMSLMMQNRHRAASHASSDASPLSVQPANRFGPTEDGSRFAP